jgi:eukaryotic-like serine/threonine-protein kinase
MGIRHSHTCKVLLTLVVTLSTGCGGLKLTQPLKLTPGDRPLSLVDESRDTSAAKLVVPPLTREWEFDLTGGIGNGAPVIVDSILLMGNLRGEFYALNAFTGKQLGWFTPGNAVQSSPALHGSTVYIPLTNTDNSLIAYDLLDGTINWRRECGDIEASPLSFIKRIYVGNTEGTFRCIDAIGGNLIWSYDLPDNGAHKGIRTTALAVDSTIIFGAEDGYLYALDATSGRLRWRTMTGGSIFGSPARYDGAIIVGNTRGTITAVSFPSGSRLWSVDAGAPIYAAITCPGGRLFVGTTGGAMLAIDPASGSMLWRYETASVINASAVVSGGTLYFGTLGKKLYALRASDGGLLSVTELNGRVKTPLAVAHGRLFVATDDKVISSYKGVAP